MTPPIAILLPGLHGTVDLFARFVAAAPDGFPLQCQALPNDKARGYDELAEWVRDRLPPDPVVLIGESFSGALALLIADRCPRVAGVVMSAGFVEAPLPRFLSHAPGFVWNVPPPTMLLSALLTGGDRSLAGDIKRTVATVPANVLELRASAALHLDARTELARYSRPLLYLRGTHDRLIAARSAERIRGLNPSAVVIPVDAPHMILQCTPNEAWNHIAAFMEQCEGRASTFTCQS